jgi:Uma2 family endonuclease
MLAGMSQRPESWVVDPDDPRAPPMEVWERLTAEQRARVVQSLPSEFEPDEAAPPEGDFHFNAKVDVRRTLGRFYERVGKRVYLACELPVYYPGEKMFAPDVMAVLDVERRDRERWVVADEGKGLDLALEIFVSGRRRKDYEHNVERYARLGILEYFIFDRGRLHLKGFRLPAVGSGRYEPILPQHGHYASGVLGLELALEDNKLRFYYGDAPVPEAEELIHKLETMVDGLEIRLADAERRALEEARLREEETRLREEETRLREEETRLREEEARLREETERKLEDALLELERLKGR